MFGKVKHHFNRAVAFGKGAVHYGVQAYHKGVQYASHVDNALKIARQGLHILKPLANEIPYGNSALHGGPGGSARYRRCRTGLNWATTALWRRFGRGARCSSGCGTSILERIVT